LDINNKVFVITGAGRGLGAAIAKGLASKGASLALVDINQANLELTSKVCKKYDSKITTYLNDISIEDDVIKLFNMVIDDHGRLDGLVNNAGILRDGLLVKSEGKKIINKMSLDDWQSVINVNLTGVFLCGREAAQHMIKIGSNGCIINISSISRRGNFGQTNYSAAKAGVAALTKVWAKELAKYNIRTNAIAPGFVNTEMVKNMRPEILEKGIKKVPLRRLCNPEEIAHTSIYIAENDYLNGAIIEVDGGPR
tara:strand:- start:13883 stop:14641 length:759 start_codon:yes stop_codon:yes gene_type:complete